MLDAILKRFETPDETRTLPQEHFEVALIVGIEPYVSLHFEGAGVHGNKL